MRRLNSRQVLRISLTGAIYAVMLFSAFRSTYTALSIVTESKSECSCDSSKFKNEAIGEIEQIVDDYDLTSEATGIWKVGDPDEYGLTFLFGIALDYFRCSVPKSKPIYTNEDLKDLSYVISPWEVDELVNRGFTLIHNENWVYLYKAPPSAE